MSDDVLVRMRTLMCGVASLRTWLGVETAELAAGYFDLDLSTRVSQRVLLYEMHWEMETIARGSGCVGGVPDGVLGVQFYLPGAVGLARGFVNDCKEIMQDVLNGSGQGGDISLLNIHLVDYAHSSELAARQSGGAEDFCICDFAAGYGV